MLEFRRSLDVSARPYRRDFPRPLWPARDTTECTSNTYDDDSLATLLEMENSNEATRIGNTFHYPVELHCGGAYGAAVQYMCEDLKGTSICTQGIFPGSRIMPRESKLGKRTATYCRDYTEKCFDTIEANEFGNCPDGYATVQVEAKGQPPGFYCTRECSQEKKDECLRNACDIRRKECQRYPGSRELCGDALLKCRLLTGPVSMNEDICNDNIIIPIKGDPNCTGCVSYVNGQCKVDSKAFDAYLAASDARADQLVKFVLNRGWGTL